jgi:hypothetical protein
MFSIIGSIFKYTTFGIIVLIASHMIQFKDVTIANHIHQFLRWAKVDTKISLESVTTIASSPEISSEDEEELLNTIQKSFQKK